MISKPFASVATLRCAAPVLVHHGVNSACLSMLETCRRAPRRMIVGPKTESDETEQGKKKG